MFHALGPRNVSARQLLRMHMCCSDRDGDGLFVTCQLLLWQPKIVLRDYLTQGKQCADVADLCEPVCLPLV